MCGELTPRLQGESKTGPSMDCCTLKAHPVTHLHMLPLVYSTIWKLVKYSLPQSMVIFAPIGYLAPQVALSWWFERK